MYRWIFFLGVCSLLAVETPYIQREPEEELPWLTGPLIALSSEIMPLGSYNLEPYIFATANTGAYNSDWKLEKKPTLWNFIFEPVTIVGLTSFMDLYILPTASYNLCQGESCWAWGDFSLGLDFQLYHDVYLKHDWYPNIKFSVVEIFPSGKFDRLDPNKKGTQIGGQGSFATEFELILGKLTHFSGVYFMSSRIALTYTVPAPTSVQGFSVYGGGYGTKGKVYPAQSLNADLAFEFTLSKNWVFAIDIIGNWSGETRFKGDKGSPRRSLLLTKPPSFQFTLAPAIEYNWSSQIGIIFGPWFTVAGKNATQFFSGVFAFNYYN